MYGNRPAGTKLTTQEQLGAQFLHLGEGGGLITHHLWEERQKAKRQIAMEEDRLSWLLVEESVKRRGT